ncbi:MAG: hypothetical protein GX265_05825 [Mollicutes bacterium]|nr:hypothetical protein [Mollicutes bacterium]
MYFQKTKKIKIWLMFILFFCLAVILFFYKKNIKKNNIDRLCLNFTSEEQICLYENVLFYDKTNDIYYFPLSRALRDKEYYFTVDKDENKQYYINNELLKPKTYKLDFENSFNYKIINDKTELLNISIKFINLPIINIKTNDNIYDAYKNVSIEIFSIDEFYTKNATIKLRGLTSRTFAKNPYKIEFKTNNSKKSKILLDENEDWALDALYSDPSKIRNKLSTDIWNYINSTNEMSVLFIELFINNEYQGLYTIKEMITRKKLNLEQLSANGSGILIKGINYYPIDWNSKEFNIHSNIYNSLEMKYPNEQISYSKYWSIFLSKLANYYKTQVNSLNIIQKTFDIDNYLNYKIFVELISGNDNNYTKNCYFSMKNKNSNIIKTPWDMDLTFGLYFHEYQPLLSEKNYTLVSSPVDNNNFTGNEAYLKALKERYFYLRRNGLSKEYIFNLIDDYVEDIYYASLRDSNRWYEYDIIKETEEIKEWVSKRFDYLDKKFKGL